MEGVVLTRYCVDKICGNRKEGELWGVDFSHKQLENAERYLSENGYAANFICSPTEADMDVPKEYFDFVYSRYGIAWTTDLDGTFQKIASYLKKDGIFIFSWHHTDNIIPNSGKTGCGG